MDLGNISKAMGGIFRNRHQRTLVSIHLAYHELLGSWIGTGVGVVDGQTGTGGGRPTGAVYVLDIQREERQH